MNLLLYSVFAIAILGAVALLLRRSAALDSNDGSDIKRQAPSVGSSRWLSLSERIFDPSDARWLAEDLAFPKLAQALTLDRRHLALEWLKALQSSFDELVRTPAALPQNAMSETGGWTMLWMVVRFKFLISYALFVVTVFGPYHRLIPSFNWLPFRGIAQKPGREALAGTQSGR